jgi:hypothetical protein
MTDEDDAKKTVVSAERFGLSGGTHAMTMFLTESQWERDPDVNFVARPKALKAA